MQTVVFICIGVLVGVVCVRVYTKYLRSLSLMPIRVRLAEALLGHKLPKSRERKLSQAEIMALVEDVLFLVHEQHPDLQLTWARKNSTKWLFFMRSSVVWSISKRGWEDVSENYTTPKFDVREMDIDEEPHWSE